MQVAFLGSDSFYAVVAAASRPPAQTSQHMLLLPSAAAHTPPQRRDEQLSLLELDAVPALLPRRRQAEPGDGGSPVHPRRRDSSRNSASSPATPHVPRFQLGIVHGTTHGPSRLSRAE